MDPFVSQINILLAILTIIGQGIVVLILFALLFLKKKHPMRVFLNKNAIFLALIAATVATAGSLFYSEVAGYEPCKLCWIQRIFMYPQVILLAIAWWMKDSGIKKYALGLSVPGFFVAGYHYMMQRGVVDGSCDAVGYSVSCSKQFVMQYDYITIPMMAFTAFAMIIVFFLSLRVDGR